MIEESELVESWCLSVEETVEHCIENDSWEGETMVDCGWQQMKEDLGIVHASSEFHLHVPHVVRDMNTIDHSL
ncbi:hypothetical protein Tco_0340110 [Tanacetum coccineum]